MIVEFFGLPGCGKTTIVSQQVKLGHPINLRVGEIVLKSEMTKPDRLEVILSALARPRFLWIVLRLCWSCRHGGVDTLRYVYRFLMKVHMTRIVSKAQKVYLCDELGIQAFWSVFVKAESVNHRLIMEVLRYLKPLYAGTRIVFVSDSNYDVVRRINLRDTGTSRFDSFSDEEKRYYILTGKHVMDWFLYYMEELDYPFEIYENKRTDNL